MVDGRRFVARLFNHVLEDPSSMSTLIYSLSVCKSLLDPKRAASVAAARGQHPMEPVTSANPEAVEGMLQRLGMQSGKRNHKQVVIVDYK